MNNKTQPPEWLMMKGLKPKLCPHIQVNPQWYRGERWFVLRDAAGGRHLRFNSIAYEVIGRLDGDRSLEDIWLQVAATLGEQALNQEDMVHLVTQLLAIDALRTGIPVATETMLKRDLNARRMRWRQKLMNPLALRVPLFDPDRFLNATISWVRPLFSKVGLIAWFIFVAFASLLALTNSTKLAAAMTDNIMATENILLLWLLYPVIKACHELAHAYAVKLWGGEVHEMGITFLILMPAPYIDASSAWSFRQRRKRVLVGAAGIMAELFLAALGLFIWLSVEPGVMSQIGLITFMTGAISTVIFNANPLLRFDGYFMLQDLVEIPNLASRSSRYYLYLLQRYCFGLHQARSPVTAPGERYWFVCYGLSSFVYRLFILAVIVLFLAEDYLFIGVGLAFWAITLQLILPLWRGLTFLLASEKLVEHRRRAMVATTGLLALIASALFFIPMPLTTFAQGVVWVPEQSQIYVATDGFVTDVLVPSGVQVEPGTELVRMRSPVLEKKIAVLKAESWAMNIQMTKALRDDPVQLKIITEEATAIAAELEQLHQQREALTVRSRQSGVFVVPDESRLNDRYLRRGELIGYVISPERLIVRTVVAQADIGLVRERAEGVQVRLAEHLDSVVDAQVIRMTPASSKELPSLALSVEGGGKVTVDRGTDGEVSAREPMFQVDLSLPEGLDVSGLGERAYVRFDHGSEALAQQWWRSGRQLLLSRLSL